MLPVSASNRLITALLAWCQRIETRAEDAWQAVPGDLLERLAKSIAESFSG